MAMQITKLIRVLDYAQFQFKSDCKVIYNRIKKFGEYYLISFTLESMDGTKYMNFDNVKVELTKEEKHRIKKQIMKAKIERLFAK